jgi:hypothetical protein
MSNPVSVLNNPAASNITFRWLDDDDVLSCLQCNKEFDFFNRKHHCRRCGGIFCSTCSNYLHFIPDSELITPKDPKIASSINKSERQRTCEKCSKYFMKKSTNVEESQIFDVLEYHPGRPSRTYTVRLPPNMTSGRLVKVSLDNRMWTVRIPLNICPGSTILVRAPFSANQLPAANVAMPSTISTIGPCPQCTYFNHEEDRTTCLICESSLFGSSTASEKMPRVKVIGFEDILPDDVEGDDQDDHPDIQVKEYSTSIPKDIHPGEIFIVKLDGKMYSVICPPSVSSGCQIIVLVPEIKPRYALPPIDDISASTTTPAGASDIGPEPDLPGAKHREEVDDDEPESKTEEQERQMMRESENMMSSEAEQPINTSTSDRTSENEQNHEEDKDDDDESKSGNSST